MLTKSKKKQNHERTSLCFVLLNDGLDGLLPAVCHGDLPALHVVEAPDGRLGVLDTGAEAAVLARHCADHRSSMSLNLLDLEFQCHLAFQLPLFSTPFHRLP